MQPLRITPPIYTRINMNEQGMYAMMHAGCNSSSSMHVHTVKMDSQL